MRDVLKSIFTEYSTLLWNKINSKFNENNEEIQEKLDSKITMGSDLNTSEPVEIFFKEIEWGGYKYVYCFSFKKWKT